MADFTCPRCKAVNAGYFVKIRATIKTWFDSDGAADDSEVHRHGGGAVKYCSDCKKPITAAVDKFQKEAP